jgi:hypothetical protein
MQRTTTIPAAVLLLSLTCLTAGEIWKWKADDNVKWMRVSVAGPLLYSTDKSLSAVDAESGKQLWTRTDLAKLEEFSVEEVLRVPLVFVADNEGKMQRNVTLHAVNPYSGQDVWKSEKLAGSIMDIVPDLKRQAILFITTKGNGGSKMKLVIQSLDMNTGETRFQLDMDDEVELFIPDRLSTSGGMGMMDAFKMASMRMDLSGHPAPTVEGDDLYLPYAGLHKIDLKTGAIAWKSVYDVTEKHFKRANASPLVVDSLVISSAKGVLKAFDRQSGTLKWTSTDFGSGVADMVVGEGVIYGRTGGVFYETSKREFQVKKPLGVVALDLGSGAMRWKYDGAKESITNIVALPEAKSVLIADEKNLIGISMDASGKDVKESFRVPLQFKSKVGAAKKVGRIGRGMLRGGAVGGIMGGKEQKSDLDAPLSLTKKSPESIIVRGKQHIIEFNAKSRDIEWGQSFEAPGVSNWQKVAAATAFAFTYMHHTAQAASTNFGSSENTTANASRRDDVDRYNKVLAKRFNATLGTEQYVYMLTDLKTEDGKGPGIKGINLATGEADREVLFGDKQPRYVVDEDRALVFRTHKDGGEIFAYSLQQ